MNTPTIKYGKTLRGLLSSLPFDELVPIIQADANRNYAVACYKEAYDILLHIDPKGDEPLDIHVCRHTDKDGKLNLLASDLEGCPWEDFIDGDIYLEEGPEISDAYLAYTLLWHMTFYGYNERTKQESYKRIMFGDRPNNQYGRLAFETVIKRDYVLADKITKQAILKSVRENEAEGGMSYSLSENQWEAIEYRRCHCNGSKRKRDARLQRRIERLDREALCERTILRLLENQRGTTVSEEDLSFLKYAEKRTGFEFQSHSYDISSRLQYIIEMICRYGAVSLAFPVGNIVVRLAASQEYPLSGTEISKIIDLIRGIINPERLIICLAEDDSLNQEVSVLTVGCR